MATTVYLPDLEAGWLWPRRLNIHTAEIKQECLKWVASFGAFTPQAQQTFDKCNFNLLAGLMYPRLTREQLRCACDVMNLFFIFDEHSDRSEPADVWNQVDRPDGCSAQSRNTSTGRRMGRRYLEVRRQTIGVMPSLAFFQMGMDLTDEVLTHRTIRALEMLAVDLTIIANDVLSYDKKQASGDDEHNLITIVMKEFHCNLQQAIDWAAKAHAELVQQFNQTVLVVPRWGGPVDLDVQIYVDGIAQWVGANVQWSFESERYFGKRGLEIKKTRILQLLTPKVKAEAEIGPFAVDNLLYQELDEILPGLLEMVRSF
ncbi:hypothetical protein TruAng_011351 [Truncatella angustata]|nr:hypothetical protein TruAng_011351 [Truncatella angustata]